MKNITITLKEEVAHWVRIWAAQHGVSTSRMISNLLTSHMNEGSLYQSAQEEFLKRRPKHLKKSGKNYPSRQNLYE